MNVPSFFVASPFNILIVLPIVVAIYVVYRYVQNNEPEKVSATLDIVLYLSGITILFGALGFFLEMNRAACKPFSPGSSFVSIICTVPESAEQVSTMATCYGRSASVMLVGLFASLILALVWYMLRVSKRFI